MLEGPSALALHTCCRLLGRATGAEFNVNLNRGGGCVRALSLGPLPHEVESLENDYWMNPAEVCNDGLLQLGNVNHPEEAIQGASQNRLCSLGGCNLIGSV